MQYEKFQAQCGLHRKLISNIAHGKPIIDNNGYINLEQNESEKIDILNYQNEMELIAILQKSKIASEKYYYIGVADSLLGHDYSIIQKGDKVCYSNHMWGSIVWIID